ncbi:uncharacterized protein LOC143232577 [Tachypleus tridentatus]|uniref:uncharacterized protein LOC143232577 n=1 Tax=Tachypleus tridentatus TaxID=6853 RepID=UPI003FD46548
MAQQDDGGTSSNITSSSPASIEDKERSTSLPFPVIQQAQQYLEQNVRAWMTPCNGQGFLKDVTSPEVIKTTQADASHISLDRSLTFGSSGPPQMEPQETSTLERRSRIPLKRHENEAEVNLPTGVNKLQSPKRLSYFGIPVSCSVPHSLSLSGNSQRSAIQGSSYSSPCRGKANFIQPSAAASFFARSTFVPLQENKNYSLAQNVCVFFVTNKLIIIKTEYK